MLLEKHCCREQRSCWQKTWRPALGFSVQLVRKLAAKYIGEFRVMFGMPADSFDGLLRRFP